MNKNTQMILVAGAAVVALTYFFRQQAADAVAAVAEINEGTPYEGAGALGTLGNVTDKASGGVLSRVGSGIGLFFSDLLGGRISIYGRAGS